MSKLTGSHSQYAYLGCLYVSLQCPKYFPVLSPSISPLEPAYITRLTNWFTNKCLLHVTDIKRLVECRCLWYSTRSTRIQFKRTSNIYTNCYELNGPQILYIRTRKYIRQIWQFPWNMDEMVPSNPETYETITEATSSSHNDCWQQTACVHMQAWFISLCSITPFVDCDISTNDTIYLK